MIPPNNSPDDFWSFDVIITVFHRFVNLQKRRQTFFHTFAEIGMIVV
jgi:hypothetical protein